MYDHTLRKKLELKEEHLNINKLTFNDLQQFMEDTIDGATGLSK